MKSLPPLTREASRRVDQIAIDQLGIPGIVLMENAGRGTVCALLQFDADIATTPGVAILCGRGNNGGDGFVIARHLMIRNIAVRTLLLAAPSGLTGDALHNYQALANCGGEIVDLSSSDRLTDELSQHTGGATWLVDALLGTGATGPPRPPYDDAIRWMNDQSARRLAVDVPSGLDCDTGEAHPPTVRADLTCTFVAEKVGFAKPAAQPYLGELQVVDIGVPSTAVAGMGC